MTAFYRDKFKLLVIGNAAVGRTWLIHSFVYKEDTIFPYTATIGMDFEEISMEGRDGNTYKLDICELAGHEAFLQITESYFRSASGFLLLFDVTRKNTFDNAIGKWMEYINSFASTGVPVILVGTKCDCSDSERAVSRDRIRMVCDDMDILFIEVSAKTRTNIDFLFQEILSQMIHHKHQY